MPVEELAFRALAHGVKPKQDLLQKLRRVELILLRIEGFVLRFNQLIEIGENGIVRRRQL